VFSWRRASYKSHQLQPKPPFFAVLPTRTERSTRYARDAFYASLLFPRLLKADALRATSASGVSESQLGYIGPQNANGKYDPFYFDQPLSPADVEISDDVFIFPKEEAKRHIEPRQLTTFSGQ
jgi:hypothetical protein